MIKQNDPVKFSYIAHGASLPASPEDGMIYIAEDAGEIWVGDKLIATNVYTSGYEIKTVEFSGSGNCVTNIGFDNVSGVLTVRFGTIGGGGGDIECRSTAEWDLDPTKISDFGTVYIYTDYQNIDNQNVPGMKVGDGSTPIVDLPFTTKKYDQHVADTSIHVTDEEKLFWNDKMRCYMSTSNPENLIFTTD